MQKKGDIPIFSTTDKKTPETKHKHKPHQN